MSIYKTAEKSELIKKHEPSDYECEVSIGKGWEGIVNRLTEQIDYIDPQFVVNQVKEKFGGLRYYVSNISEDEVVQECIYTLIRKAEHEASVTCECCGTQQSVSCKSTERGWVATLCDRCRTAIDKE